MTAVKYVLILMLCTEETKLSESHFVSLSSNVKMFSLQSSFKQLEILWIFFQFNSSIAVQQLLPNKVAMKFQQD